MAGAMALRHCSRLSLIRCSKDDNSTSSIGKKSVLIIGATGRVGGSTARALAKACPSLKLLLGGRNREKGVKLAAELGNNSEFCELDIDNQKLLISALNGVDLVVHAAGPFQRAKECTVLEAAIANKTYYIDVSDDWEYSCLAKSFHKKACAAQVPCITTAGIYPGVSNLMAAELVRLARSSTSTSSEPERLRFSYFTAGSGGAGPTILATSFLLLGEDAIAYHKGKRIQAKPYSGVIDMDFGKGVGKRPVYLLNLPEVGSAYEILGVPTTFFNDRKKVQTFANVLYPLVRAIDGIVGELMSIRVDLDCKDGRKAVGIYTHKKMSM
eukprot:TRINITY_DN17922_c0_g1_i3.p1 TRINITY_DN17922_c0_g1~~TRINITY_DN17922_c0_g1_i3.p1  ORF type:complete len:326 (-),score=58.88 TRINITY_DN17922_c0_g1_i3:26-1003(-)